MPALLPAIHDTPSMIVFAVPKTLCVAHFVW